MEGLAKLSSSSFNTQGPHSDRYWYIWQGGAKNKRQNETERKQQEKEKKSSWGGLWVLHSGHLRNEGARGGGVDHLWKQGIPLPRRSGEEGVEAVVCLVCYPVKVLCVLIPVQMFTQERG